MGDDHVGPLKGGAGRLQGGENLFVHPMPPANIVAPAEQSHMIDPALRGAGSAGAQAGHQEGRLFVAERIKQFPESATILPVEPIVGIQPENPFSRGMSNRLIAGIGKAVGPGMFEDARPERPGDLGSAIGRAGVHDDDFIEHLVRADQTFCQVRLLVANDHR